MALRLVEIYLSKDRQPSRDWAEDHALMGSWLTRREDDGYVLRALLDTEHSEKFIDALQDEYGDDEDFRVVMLSVEATVPRNNGDDEPDEPEKETEKEERTPRISREELYEDVAESVRGTKVYYTLVVLSTIVAAGGMLRDDVAVVVGAMVIAPLIGPSLALALATTLGDTVLLKKSLQVNVVGLLAALALSVVIGLVLDITPTNQVAARTVVDLGAIALALAAGIAGALSVTRGISTALIGVMVAVALLPPLVAAGMLLGAGYYLLAYNAGLLLFINVTAVNLASVATFVAQGIRPTTWYEHEEAKKHTRYALVCWVILMVILVIAAMLSPDDLLPQ